MKSALLVFAKAPSPGAVKTRLTDLLSPEEAADLYEAFLRDALAQYAALDAAVRLYVAPPAAEFPTGLAPDGVSVHEQRGEGLGARMQQAFLETFADGYERLVIVGTDHPTLPSAFIERAFAALEEPLATCIGPSADGGYYLLGMNEFYPQLFDGMTYSHDAVFAETLRRVETTAAALTVLPQWYDVDTPAALGRLAADLAETKAPPAERTRAAVQRLLQTYPSLRPQSAPGDAA